MPSSRALVKTVSSVNLVFGLDWFAMLGGVAAREVRHIARQHRATHAVCAGDDAGSAGVVSLRIRTRSNVFYSAAQLVAQQFSAGVVALITRLDADQWWLVAVHEGAVIARTDHVCTSFDEASALVVPLRQAYPSIVVLNDQDNCPTVEDLAANLHAEAELRRAGYGGWLSGRPLHWLALGVVILFMVYRVSGISDFMDARKSVANPAVDPASAWQAAIDAASRKHRVHGVTGTSGLLDSLYSLPVGLNGWRMHQAECVASPDEWQCHANYQRHDSKATNEGFLHEAPSLWKIVFAPLDQVRVYWKLAVSDQTLMQTPLRDRRYTEHQIFSRLQAIRPAFALIRIDAPLPVPVTVPVDDHGVAVVQPPGLPNFHMRALRIQAPLRSLSLLLPYTEAMAWHRIVLSLNPQTRPDLIHSRLDVILEGTLYEQD